ncbi:MAG: preprotein translocase subunit YajC [Maritimibacter sp.]
MFVSPAFAQAAGGAAGGAMSSLLIPMVLVFGIMYFLIIRPQQRKQKEDEAMRNAVRRGDQVLTQGGIIGKVVKVRDDSDIDVEIAEGVKVRMTKAAILTVMSKTEPAADSK